MKKESTLFSYKKELISHLNIYHNNEFANFLKKLAKIKPHKFSEINILSGISQSEIKIEF
ncbi:hypothetical protein [Tepidibacter hydrothermalis]|uniref:Uncharacterized protein n=1 Tax=Tepidibacter hydrothermalis TaxID=3036126 RepID=A0ABY8EJC1_9FIRM|nr:hypothetical protein [Tepidibacter hydrothermalis]WFD11115.1 hypothetical protein P4S50_03300 [Tepidibacter hydrothermalis]